MIQSNRLRIAWLVLTLAVVARGQATDSKAAKPEASANPPAAEPANAAGATAEAPLKIDAEGYPYREIRIEKRPGSFVRVGENDLRIFGGYVFPILSEDETAFIVKQRFPKDSGEVEMMAPRQRASDPAAIAKFYEFAAPDVDQLELVAAEQGLPRQGQWRNGFDLADFDGDGKLDIVFGPARKGAPRPNLFLNQGGGRWRSADDSIFPAGSYDYGDAKAADLDGDGRIDLAFGFHLLGMSALVDDGKGKFREWHEGIALRAPQQESQGEYSSRALRIADWNRDRKPDLIALGDGPSAPRVAPPGSGGSAAGKPAPAAMGLMIYLNQGDGTWKAWRDPSPLGSSVFGDSLAVEDLDGDGDLDVVAGSRQIGRTEVVGLQQKDGSIVWSALPGMRPRTLIDSVVIEDLDRDGRRDLAIGYRSNEGVWRSGVDLYFGSAGGFVRQPLFARTGAVPVAALAVGDVDGDGAADLVAPIDGSEMWLFLASGPRAWARETVSSAELGVPNGCDAYSARIADLDRDGTSEIVVGFAGEDVDPILQGRSKSLRCATAGSLRVFSARRAAVTAEGSPR